MLTRTLLIAGGGGHFLLPGNIRSCSRLWRFAVSARSIGPFRVVIFGTAASRLVYAASSSLRLGSRGHALLAGNTGSRTWLWRFAVLVFCFGGGIRHAGAGTLTTAASLLIRAAGLRLANLAWGTQLAGNVGSDCRFWHFAVLAARLRRAICLSNVRALAITSIPLVARIFLPRATGGGWALLTGDIGTCGGHRWSLVISLGGVAGWNLRSG